MQNWSHQHHLYVLLASLGPSSSEVDWCKVKSVIWSYESTFQIVFGICGCCILQAKEEKDCPKYQCKLQQPASLMGSVLAPIAWLTHYCWKEPTAFGSTYTAIQAMSFSGMSLLISARQLARLQLNMGLHLSDWYNKIYCLTLYFEKTLEKLTYLEKMFIVILWQR